MDLSVELLATEVHFLITPPWNVYMENIDLSWKGYPV